MSTDEQKEGVLAWRYTDQDINGDEWPWTYTTSDAAAKRHGIYEPLYDATTITALQERIKELEGALRPFALMADQLDEWVKGSSPDFEGAFDAGDLRTARSTLKDSGNGSEVAR